MRYVAAASEASPLPTRCAFIAIFPPATLGLTVVGLDAHPLTKPQLDRTGRASGGAAVPSPAKRRRNSICEAWLCGSASHREFSAAAGRERRCEALGRPIRAGQAFAISFS